MYAFPRIHCLNFSLPLLDVNASIIQGSAIGPLIYVVNAADLQAVTPPGNIMVKYADDTYLVIPACNIDSREREISNIEACSLVNNLTLNQSKSAEIVFTDSRKRRLVQSPPPLQGIARVTSLKMLGVTVNKYKKLTSLKLGVRTTW